MGSDADGVVAVATNEFWRLSAVGCCTPACGHVRVESPRLHGCSRGRLVRCPARKVGLSVVQVAFPSEDGPLAGEEGRLTSKEYRRADGKDHFASCEDHFASGADHVADGKGPLANGAGAFANSAHSFASGAGSLADVARPLANGARPLGNGERPLGGGDGCPTIEEDPPSALHRRLSRMKGWLLREECRLADGAGQVAAGTCRPGLRYTRLVERCTSGCCWCRLPNPM